MASSGRVPSSPTIARALPEIGAGCAKVGAQIWVRAKGKSCCSPQIPDVNAALVAMNPQDGAIGPWSAASSFELSKFNPGRSGRRQVGSNIKLPLCHRAGTGLYPGVPHQRCAVSPVGSCKGPHRQNSPAIYEGPTTLRSAFQSRT